MSQPIEHEQVVEQLSKITSGRTLSDRQKRVLRFLVTEALAGRADDLSDAFIAAKFYAGNDNAMRAEAGRLREKLDQYYRAEGRLDLIIIEIPKGGYAAVFSRAESPSSFIATVGNILSAYQDKRWADVLNGTKTLLSTVDETQLGKLERAQIPKVQILRFFALILMRRFDELSAESASLDLHDASFWGDQYPLALSLSLFVFEISGQAKRAAEVRERLFGLATPDDIGQSLEVAKAIIRAAQALADKSDGPLYGPALALLDRLTDRIRTIPGVEFHRLCAKAFYLTVYYSLESRKPEDALERHSKMEKAFPRESDDDTIAELVWAGTEATRALRILRRPEQADKLATALAQRFRHVSGAYAQSALCWALAERSKSLFSTGQFAEAAELCSAHIAEWDGADVASELEWPLAWTHAQMVLSLNKARRYSEAVAVCDTAISRFGESTDVNVQFEIAWILMEKAVALRRSQRLAASVAAAREVITRFGGSTDQRIATERIWAIHAEGAAVLCEAKLLRQTGLQEDAVFKLEAASGLFMQAAEKAPDEPLHLGCQAYAQFLLGQTAEAERTFAKALKLGDPTWLDEDDWTETSMFPLPEDAQFVEAVKHWRTRSNRRRFW